MSRYQYEIYEDSDGSIGKNGLLRSVKKARRIEFDDTKSHAENSMDANKNRLIEAYLKVLTDKSRTSQLKISIDNDTKLLKNVLSVVESNQETKHPATFSTYTPQYQEKIKAEYTTGKAGIGPMALNNAHHILTQLFNVRFSTDDKLVEALDIVDTNKVYDRDNNRILSWLSALINAFVDIAKDPYIIRLNVNPWTYNMTTFMIRMGFGEKTFYLLSQPILKEMALAVSTTKGKYGVDQSKTPYQLEQEAIKSVLDKYDPSGEQRKHYEGFGVDKVGMFAQVFNTDMLKEVFTKPQDNKDLFNAEQVRIYYAFKALLPYARALADLVKYSKVDTKKTGKTILQQLVFRNGMEELTKHHIFHPGDVTSFFNNSFIEKKTANSVDLLRELMQGLILSCNPVIINTVNLILRRIGKQTTAGEQLLNTIQNSIIANVKSDFILHLMSEDGVTYDKLLRGTNTLAHRLSYIIRDIRAGRYPDLLDPNGNIDNALLNYIQPVTSNRIDPFALSFIRVVDNTASNEDKNRDDVINSWEYLLNHPNETISEFARDLVYYAFITSGDNPGANSFFWAVPLSWRKSSGYSDWMGMMTTSSNWSINDDLIYRNNIMNNDLVPTYERFNRIEETTEIGGMPMTTQIEQSFVGLLSKDKYPGLDYSVHGIMFGIRKLNDTKSEIRLNDGGFPKFIKIKVGRGIQNPYALYKLLGTMVTYLTVPGRKTPKEVLIPVYGLTSKKGYRQQGNVIVDYNSTGTLFENEVTEFPQELVSSPAGIETMYKLLERNYGLTFASDFRGTFTLDTQKYPVTYLETEVLAVAYEDVSDNPTEFVNHSGGAPGSDTVWGQIAEEYGIPSRHYYHGEISSANAPLGNTEITEQDYEEGKTKAALAAKRNWGYQYQTMKDDRLVRNWSQVKYADEIFAIGLIVQPGEKAFPNQPNDTRVAVNPMVAGGTGYAVGMAINEGKPVHVFDLIKNKWYIWNGENFVEEDTPTLSKNFAGIGTRQINESGKQAIRDVFAKTFGDRATFAQYLRELQSFKEGLRTGIYRVYQGRHLKKDDSRHFNYYTISKKEAGTYGEIVEEYIINTDGFLQGYGRDFELYYQLRQEFHNKTGKYPDILDNTESGMQTQYEFYDWLSDKGFKGLDLITRGPEYVNFLGIIDSDNAYLVTFYTAHDGVSNFAEKQSLFDNMSQEDLNAIEKQKEEHNKKCNR